MNIIKNTIQNTILFGCFTIAMIAPAIAFADDVPNIEGMLKAIGDKNYPFVVAFGISILVYFLRRVGPDKIFPKKYVPYVVLGIALLSGSATGILNEDVTWWHGLIKGLLEGLSAGLMAMGFYSAGLKNILKIPKEE